MPGIGDRARGRDIGLEDTHEFVYYACPDCGNARWIVVKQIKQYQGRCVQCAGKAKRGRGMKYNLRGANNPAWKGGRTLMKTGYIRMSVYPEDPLVPMATRDWTHGKFWMTEHRYVMAKHLGRCLQPWEVVHHKNGDKTDNRIENLELLSGKDARQQHMAFILLQQENETLKQRLAQLEARVTLLEAERVLGRV